MAPVRRSLRRTVWSDTVEMAGAEWIDQAVGSGPCCALYQVM